MERLTLKRIDRAVVRAAIDHARRYDSKRAQPAPVIAVTGNCPFCGDTLYRGEAACVAHRDLPAVEGGS